MPSAMTRDHMLDAIAAQRLRVAEAWSKFDESDWNTPSLCAGWRNVEVAAHLVSILDVPIWRFALGSIRRGGFNAYADTMARQLSRRGGAELMRSLAGHATSRFAPPVVGPIAPLTDILVHTRDVERPLGIASTLPEDAMRAVLDFLTGPKTYGFVGKGIVDGFRFVATDLDWAMTNPGTIEIAGSAEALMMALAARPAALADLTGPGVPDLRRRLAS